MSPDLNTSWLQLITAGPRHPSQRKKLINKQANKGGISYSEQARASGLDHPCDFFFLLIASVHNLTLSDPVNLQTKDGSHKQSLQGFHPLGDTPGAAFLPAQTLNYEVILVCSAGRSTAGRWGGSH